MLKKRMEEALNTQINAGIWSAHFFLSLSLHFTALGWPGFSYRMQRQYEEEQRETFKMIDYVQKQEGRILLGDIVDVPVSFGNVSESLDRAMVHLVRITDSIDTLADEARNENDKATRAMLDWFILRRVEEESAMSELISRVKNLGDGVGLYLLDRELLQKDFKA
ncbi:ferritin [Coprobacter tertius]|uniref:Ferritin n=1 Tax=Coprobacter tertius TaxID=2944915 RepID=A0ABT1MEJ4_9BACT|nr:ferritin [Coprobacter tertius]MCP9611050.1 ferritin [Coprobacter tertius]